MGLKNFTLRVILAFLAIALGLMSGCVKAATSQVVSVAEASALIQNNQHNPDFVITDVRTAQEYSQGHIAGALNIDVNSPSFRDEINGIKKNETYLIYCESGGRSGKAAEIMAGLGFSKIYDMGGGIIAWNAASLPTEK